jgi:hypothetical protein
MRSSWPDETIKARGTNRAEPNCNGLLVANSGYLLCGGCLQQMLEAVPLTINQLQRGSLRKIYRFVRLAAHKRPSGLR